MKKEKESLILLNLDKSGQPQSKENPGSAVPLESAESTPTNDTTPSNDSIGAERPPEAPEFVTIQKRPWLLTDLLRALLVILSLVVAAGFVLILLPQPTVDKMAKDLQLRHTTAKQESIALLYLGDESKDGQFRVRGVVRNIMTMPIEQLDAAVRFYGHDGTILETTVVRMNRETIAPDETAQFELAYPNYKGEFAKYSVEFKLREGGMISYKDMRPTK
jgi:hypothetical protein